MSKSIGGHRNRRLTTKSSTQSTSSNSQTPVNRTNVVLNTKSRSGRPKTTIRQGGNRSITPHHHETSPSTNCCDSNFDQRWAIQQKSDPQISTDNFKAIEKLGKGGFGVVYLARWHHNRTDLEQGLLCALKVASKRQLIKKKAQAFIIRERDILQCCHHVSLIKLFASFKDEANIYMVLEFITGGDFFSYIRARERIDEEDARFYVAQLLLAFEYLHCCDIIYRDLKPENIMLTERGYLKLIDFGFAKRVHKRTVTMCGTPQFMSPEIILQEPYDKCVDYWALGILCYEMMTGDPPFHGQNDEELFEAILEHPIRFKTSIFTTTAANFVKGLLSRNPRKRLGCSTNSSSDLRHHPWFHQGYSFELIEQQSVPAVYVPLDLTDYTDYPLKLIEVAPVSQPTNEKWFEDF